jgi:hypothetical protein
VANKQISPMPPDAGLGSRPQLSPAIPFAGVRTAPRNPSRCRNCRPRPDPCSPIPISMDKTTSTRSLQRALRFRSITMSKRSHPESKFQEEPSQIQVPGAVVSFSQICSFLCSYQSIYNRMVVRMMMNWLLLEGRRIWSDFL